VLTDIIASHLPEIEIFSIDTGRLPEQTHELLARLEERYGPRIRLVYPDSKALQILTGAQGVNGFQKNAGTRLSCCEVRKVEPFKRAIAGFNAWVTGVRREHSATRAQGTSAERDAQYGLYKLSPLLDWTEEQIWQYIRARRLPYNALHDRQYPSHRLRALHACDSAGRASSARAVGGGRSPHRASAACIRACVMPP